ncbi:hypothetical protein [Bauldia litoralis]|uniref:hypothetical protein n=1 Tax=Bauldia litoralis TaxID=665467 RepID=UPI003263F45F
MFRLLLVLIIAAAALPLLVESTTSPCEALERRLAQAESRAARTSPLSSLLPSPAPQPSGSGMATVAVREKYPDLPPTAACYIVYYETYYRSIVGS